MGKRTRLRIWRFTPWGFKSPLSHHEIYCNPEHKIDALGLLFARPEPASCICIVCINKKPLGWDISRSHHPLKTAPPGGLHTAS